MTTINGLLSNITLEKKIEVSTLTIRIYSEPDTNVGNYSLYALFTDMKLNQNLNSNLGQVCKLQCYSKIQA